jgi:uncharacterized protein (DUF1330 family)
MAAFFIFHARVLDEQKFRQYAAQSIVTLAPYPHEILVSADQSELIDGDTALPRTVVLKFESRRVAKAWYHSPAYQAVLPLRLEATEGYCVLVDGCQ